MLTASVFTTQSVKPRNLNASNHKIFELNKNDSRFEHKCNELKSRVIFFSIRFQRITFTDFKF